MLKGRIADRFCEVEDKDDDWQAAMETLIVHLLYLAGQVVARGEKISSAYFFRYKGDHR
jgi:hypothetical protein